VRPYNLIIVLQGRKLCASFFIDIHFVFQNAEYAQNAIFSAVCAVFPLKWRADVRERGAELSFCVGGCGGRRR